MGVSSAARAEPCDKDLCTWLAGFASHRAARGLPRTAVEGRIPLLPICVQNM